MWRSRFPRMNNEYFVELRHLTVPLFAGQYILFDLITQKGFNLGMFPDHRNVDKLGSIDQNRAFIIAIKRRRSPDRTSDAKNIQLLSTVNNLNKLKCNHLLVGRCFILKFSVLRKITYLIESFQILMNAGTRQSCA